MCVHIDIYEYCGLVFSIFIYCLFLFLYGAKRGKGQFCGVIPEGAKGGGAGRSEKMHTRTHTDHRSICTQRQGSGLRVKAFTVWGFA